MGAIPPPELGSSSGKKSATQVHTSVLGDFRTPQRYRQIDASRRPPPIEAGVSEVNT